MILDCGPQSGLSGTRLGRPGLVRRFSASQPYSYQPSLRRFAVVASNWAWFPTRTPGDLRAALLGRGPASPPKSSRLLALGRHYRPGEQVGDGITGGRGPRSVSATGSG